MQPGPKPQSAAEREQKEPIRSKHRQQPPAPEAAIAPNSVQPPKWLKKEGLRIWDRLSPSLIERKLLTQVDAETFARYCRNFARWRKMQDAIDKEGETYESESQHGKLKRVNPVFLISDRLERQLLATEDRFGLNPAERQRIFAARAANPNAGDLFGASAPRPAPEKRPDDPAAQPIQPAEPEQSPIGFLN
jgi:P27 family predicted phage terminase small subunit